MKNGRKTIKGETITFTPKLFFDVDGNVTSRSRVGLATTNGSGTHKLLRYYKNRILEEEDEFCWKHQDHGLILDWQHQSKIKMENGCGGNYTNLENDKTYAFCRIPPMQQKKTLKHMKAYNRTRDEKRTRNKQIPKVQTNKTQQ